jgi:hypothetical protein
VQKTFKKNRATVTPSTPVAEKDLRNKRNEDALKDRNEAEMHTPVRAKVFLIHRCHLKLIILPV